MRTSKLLLCTAGLLICFDLGCASRVSKHMGDATRASAANMIVNPNAGTDAGDGTVAFEGETVENTMLRYRRTQKTLQIKTLPGSILQGIVSGGSE